MRKTVIWKRFCVGFNVGFSRALQTFTPQKCKEKPVSRHKSLNTGLEVRKNYLLLNWGARRAALRPYSFNQESEKSESHKDFLECLSNLTHNLTPNSLSQKWSNLPKRRIHNCRSLMRLVIFYLGVSLLKNESSDKGTKTTP